MIETERETPSFTEFNPRLIQWQYDTLKEWWGGLDYSKGVYEYLLTGTVGSAKSLLGAHQAIKHLVMFPKSRVLVGRIVRKDLEETFIQTLHDHIEGDFEEGEDYEFNIQKMKFTFYGGSETIARTWHKKNWKQFRSLKLSMAILEEANENEKDYWNAWSAIKQRLGRLPHVPQNLMVGMTNPGSPAEPIYKYFFTDKNPFRKVVYSKTEDNPFIPKWYIENLKNDLSPTEAMRMLEGKWVDDPEGVLYYNYKRERNYRDQPYIFDLNYPIDVMHDFNIGVGKPMSSAVGQFISGVFHIAKTFLIEGARTQDIMDEMAFNGIFDKKTRRFRVYGDASGRHNDTRSIKSDYDIIEKVLSNYRTKDHRGINYSLEVPRANPPIRTRHNKVNAKFCNALGQVQCYIYKEAKDADEGFRLTKLKKGAQYLEDDSFRAQHVTTAVGYWITQILNSGDGPRMILRNR